MSLMSFLLSSAAAPSYISVDQKGPSETWQLYMHELISHLPPLVKTKPVSPTRCRNRFTVSWMSADARGDGFEERTHKRWLPTQ